MRASLPASSLAGLNVAVCPGLPHPFAHWRPKVVSVPLLGNMSEDNWHYHFFDTVKGSDWLGDQDAISEFMHVP